MSAAELRAAARSRLEIGAGTRSRILEWAVDAASVDGLEGLSIGSLAQHLGMSKSGLFAHFGSKEELQLAVVEAARERFIAEVFRPSLEQERGLPRLRSLCEAWLSYARREVFRGGCFFLAASAEFDGREGVVRDRIAAIMREWLDALEKGVAHAVSEGHLSPDTDPRAVAFELNAMMMAANWSFQLFRDDAAFDQANASMKSRLDSAMRRG